MDLFEFNKLYVHSRCRVWPGFYTKALADVIDPTKAVLIMGCNTVRVGTGGQAVIRNTACAFGIATKRTPSSGPSAYFSDERPEDRAWVMDDINQLYKKLIQNPNLIAYFPEHGLGTGLSEMPTRCPKLFKEMNDVIKERFGIDYTNYTQG